MRECQQRLTSREFADWLEYFQEEWNTPNRTDHYLALVATRVQQANAKHPNQIKLRHNVLTFKRPPKAKPLTAQRKKEIAATSKAKWFAIAQHKPEKPNDNSPGT